MGHIWSLCVQRMSRFLHVKNNLHQLLNAACERTNTNFIVFALTRLGLEPTIYRTRGEHNKHYTDVVTSDIIKVEFVWYLRIVFVVQEIYNEEYMCSQWESYWIVPSYLSVFSLLFHLLIHCYSVQYRVYEWGHWDTDLWSQGQGVHPRFIEGFVMVDL
jgi:hypothetical protein